MVPDSISKVAPTRSLRLRPLSRENTAAASVEPTIAPTKTPCNRLRLNSHIASKPVSKVVTATPKVARETEGQNATRKLATRVRIPPSSKIIARARLLTK
ncbi:Uncharacterised protein [Vibrio cholerae]|nr:Uncharacterised protein [Vibrio cholerae]CSD44354.1 Uncharacterised protein [Vibrio cholerae]